MTAKRWLLCLGLFLLTIALVVGQGFVAFILAPVFLLAVAFGVIYGAVRLAIRHERRSEHRESVL
jgi:membrane associated rhomboid family serine protease